MESDLLTTFVTFIGDTGVNSIIGAVGILITIIFAIPSIKKHLKNKAKKKAQQSLLSNVSPFIAGPAVTPPQFVGRKQELKFLHDSLQKGESISLLGKRRIGKSSLLATWKKSLSQNDYTVILLDGQKQEGESLGYQLKAGQNKELVTII